MSEDEYIQQLTEECLEGDTTACVELGDLLPEKIKKIAVRERLGRVIFFITVVNILPIILGLTLMYVFEDLLTITLGFMIMGVGIIFFIITFFLSGTLVRIPKLKAILLTLFFVILWILLSFILQWFVVFCNPYHF